MKGLISASVNALKGQTSVPGDKSISHRALMIGGVAVGPTTIRGLLMGDDVLRTAKALEEMGVKIDRDKIDMYCEKTLYDDNNNIVGFVRSATYSPTFKHVIGIAMINKPYWDGKDQFKIEIDEKIFVGTVCELPFV